MNILPELKARFGVVLADLVDDPSDLLTMIRPAQDAQFGDYQANCAMPLAKQLGKAPRDIAADIVSRVDLADICEPPEIAGPGFINLRLQNEWLIARLADAVQDDRLGVPAVKQPKTYVIDYSSPNVAKPMHVGHIRSTVIGDALTRTLRFLGHRVISDNHIGDWGTQFGMIIYGYKNFVDRDAFEKDAVAELGRLYRLVNQLVEYHTGKKGLPKLEAQVVQRACELAAQNADMSSADKTVAKKARKAVKKLVDRLCDVCGDRTVTRDMIAKIDGNAEMAASAKAHGTIDKAVLEETAKLHAGDTENQRLWEDFLPKCRAEMQKLYDRLKIEFDHEYGESYYHDRLAAVVDDFERRSLSKQSEGAICVFLEGFETPMIIRKQDGAFLYATTDLATIQFRMETWKPDVILYVVDHRQSEHFDKLFAAARSWGYADLEVRHVSFGTVLGEDGKPFKTRAGDAVGLESLLDESIERAYAVVQSGDDAKRDGAALSEEEHRNIANVVGLGAIKYADLSHNRTSDYVFSYDKMLALTGNTATYLQYSYARVNGIFGRGNVNIDELRAANPTIQLAEPAERVLALELLRFADALADVADDYRPNLLTTYLFDLSKAYAKFFEQCPVLKAKNESTRNSRLLLCDLTARTIKQGLNLLGIDVVERM